MDIDSDHTTKEIILLAQQLPQNIMKNYSPDQIREDNKRKYTVTSLVDYKSMTKKKSKLGTSNSNHKNRLLK